MTTFRSVSDKSAVFAAIVRAYRVISVPFGTLVVCQQLHGNHKRSMQAFCIVSVRSFVPDH